jgi:hypothetical protein
LSPKFPFFDQNKSLEQTIQRVDRHHAYDEGRNDHPKIEDAPSGRPVCTKNLSSGVVVVKSAKDGV